MRTRLLAALLLGLAAPLASVVAAAGTCHHAYLGEGHLPPAVAGLSSSETGFRAACWGWGAGPTQNGSAGLVLVDSGSGVALSNLLWSNAAACTGDVTGTAVLLEAQTAGSGGKLAVVAQLGAEVQLDVAQGGALQSVAHTIPAPAVSGLATGSDAFGPFLDVTLAWASPSPETWALSNVPTVHVGYAVYVVTAAGGGPVSTGDRSLFTRVEATAGSQPYVTDDADTDDGLLPASQTSCHVRIRAGEVYYLALSLILDGSAATTGDPQTDPSAVETAYVGACSAGASATGVLFADGFETGTTGAWSGTVP